MHHNDDSALIGELREAMASRAARIDVSPELTDAARRAARRRSATRAAAVGVPVLAAAGVTTALAVGGGSSPEHLSIAPSHGTSPQTGTAPASHARDTAYVTRRVRAQLAADRDDVFEMTSEGGGVRHTDWMYVDPQSGVQYQQDVGTSASGAPLYRNVTVATPIDHVLHFQNTVLDPVHHTYTVADSIASSPESSKRSPSGEPTPAATINSTAPQIARALKSKRVTQDGTATIDGRRAIELTLPTRTTTTSVGAFTTSTTLDVDATSYQPLREVHVNTIRAGAQTNSATVTQEWLPATPANIALAKPAIPAGYTKVPFTSTATQ